MTIASLIVGLSLTRQVDSRPIWDSYESMPLNRQSIYIAVRDIYRLAYSGIPTSAVSSRLNFWSATSGDYYSLDSSNVPSGNYYLTCNGIYILELFDSSGNKVAETSQIRTTKIQAPTCQSYTNPDQLLNELGLSSSQGSDNVELSWNSQPGASKYEIYKDGSKVGETTGTNTTITSPGSYTVVAKDDQDNVLGESDYNTPVPFPGQSGDGENCADLICQCILALKPTLNNVADNTAAVKNAVDQVKDVIQNEVKPILVNMDTNVAEIKDLVRNIDSNLTVKRPHSAPSIDDLDLPSLEDYTPPQPTGKFEDNTTYFQDAGDADEAPALPMAPDPEAWKDENGNPMQQDDQLTRDPVPSRQPVIGMEEVMERDTPLTRDPPLQVQEEEYELRWKSSDYVRE